MDKKTAQIVWAAAGFYKGGIDGIFGSQSNSAMREIRNKFGSKYTFKSRGFNKREMIASVQACLNELDFQAGTIDGWEGHNTREALNALLFKLSNGGAEEIIERSQKRDYSSFEIPRQRDVKSFYGDPANMTGNLKMIELPFKLRIDYNLRQKTNKITVHKKCADSLYAALTEVHEKYGMEEMRRLGIDRYAGAYNKRRMRGGRSWSMHAYGCAIDFYAQPNGLRMRCPQALFCGDEYKDFLDIMEAHGWLPAIRLWGADAMHFQMARL